MGKCRLLFLQMEDTVIQYVTSVFSEIFGSTICSDEWRDDLRELNVILRSNQYTHVVVGNIKENDYKIVLNAVLVHSIKSSWILYCEKERYVFERQFLPIFFALRKTCFKKDCFQLGQKLRMQRFQEKTYYCHQKRKHIAMPIHTIYYIESDRNYIVLHQKNKILRDRVTLKEILENELFFDFVLISRGLFVNPHHIEKCTIKQLQLDNGELLYISRTQRDYVHQFLREYCI